ncbi:MBL fold metallo-hydrolase [Vibrio astriarenae]
MKTHAHLTPTLQVIHYGGKHTVTGSCHELAIQNRSVLIDCGLFQGQEHQPLDIPFSIKHIDAVLLTHSHIDHIGRLPWLIAKGYRGPIYATEATCALVPLMLLDALVLQGLQPGQAKRVLGIIERQLKPVKYHQWIPLPLSGIKACYARFQPAGHILGSAYIEIKHNEQVVVFSGDLGPSNTPLLPDPVPPKRADFLFIESTYGDKLHESIKQRSERLLTIINRSLKDGGVILIPAFSVGRTQELLFDIESLIHRHQLSGRLPIILDSRLANKVTKAYRHYRKLWSKEAKVKLQQGRHPLAFEQCITIDSYREHQRVVNRLKQSGEPAIVIAASGMCTGGRILNYLKALLPDKRTDVIFAGYQAKGTLGHALQSAEARVVIDDEVVEVNAQIHSMSGYSAHADQEDLFRFIEGIDSGVKEVHLIHGVVEGKAEFAEILGKTVAGRIVV